MSMGCQHTALKQISLLTGVFSNPGPFHCLTLAVSLGYGPRNPTDWRMQSQFLPTFRILTHGGLNKMADVLQTTFSNAFSWVKIIVFWLTFHSISFLRVKLVLNWFGIGSANGLAPNRQQTITWTKWASSSMSIYITRLQSVNPGRSACNLNGRYQQTFQVSSHLTIGFDDNTDLLWWNNINN